MRYLSRTGVQKNIASMLLSVLCFETVLPAHAWAVAANKESREKYSYRYTPAVSPALKTTVQPEVFSTGTFSPAVSAPATPEKIKTTKKHLEQPFIGGPGQPEMSSFKSVNADNMVDLFTGDFSYNIPLLDVGGYPVNIHYNGGPSIDQEASWVGLGWNVNPGTVNRSMRGLPDDYNGEDTIKRIQHIRENKTVGVNVGGGFELFGGALKINIGLGAFNNTYNGWGTETAINANISAGNDSKGSLTGSLGLSNNSQTGLNISPSLSVGLTSQDAIAKGVATIGTNYNSRTGLSGLQFNTQFSMNKKAEWRDASISGKHDNTTVGTGSVYSSFISFATPAYTPSIQMPLTNTSFTFSAKYGGEVFGAFTSLNISGYVSKQEIEKADTLQKLPGYGFLYYSKSKDQPEALLDYNREKEVYYNYKSTPHIAIPQYTHDIYSISGEGTGGMFRPYRSEVGVIYDHRMATKSKTFNLATDIGGGNLFKGGIDFNATTAFTENNPWKSTITPNLDFAEADSTFQPVFFRNPGEKTSNTQQYYNMVGGDSVVRVVLGPKGPEIPALNKLAVYSDKKKDKEIDITKPLVKTDRDKRSQVITYRTATDTKMLGLDTVIKSYRENSIPLGECADGNVEVYSRVDETIRKAHHLSELTVLNADGRRYVYGLPAYNTQQWDVTFSIDKESRKANIDKGIANYAVERDNHAETNKKGKEHYFSKDIMPPYAHSFLLTGLLSSDYVDITNNGITDDDLGDAVRFNYSMVYGRGPFKRTYRWRTPNDQGKVNYSEGLKTYSRDDKGTYLYGEKEVWYLNSVASKTMIAVFRISDKREDGLGIKDENGGIDTTQKLRRLDRIDLYSKPDLIRNGAKAKPVKSVHFEYDYSLCRNTLNNSGKPVDKNGGIVSEGSSSNVNKNKGKLTLRKIWFSYNGNYKGIKNPYAFNYGQVSEGQPANKYNPEHNSKHYDRWGSYKDPASNPSGLNNIDYSYSVQDSSKAAEYANAWNLTDIKLPSGGLMKISYEADDYAFVQDRRAMQMFKIAGFGASSTDQPKPFLYQKTPDGKSETDFDYVFIRLSAPAYDKVDAYRKYLKGTDKIYCKVSVEMPPDPLWGSGNEMIPTYLEYEPGNFGLVSGNNQMLWMKLKRIDDKHPVTLAVLQFLRLNIPSKAYPNSEMSDNISFQDAVRMLVSVVDNIQSATKGFYNYGRGKNWCSKVDTARSFARLCSPGYKKYGGGYRVKKVEVFDNWNKMTDLGDASYGQQYSYTTQQIIARDTIVSSVRRIKLDTITISSGVASYEPFIGGEENPFREPMEYQERLSVLAPKNYMYSEKPLGESFYPSATVGYSKVRVRTIHTNTKSANGWQETEFFTTKEFPTIVDFTPLDDESKKRYNPELRKLLKLNAINNITVSQGFKVELNDMNGKMKAQANYAENDPVNAIHSTRNFYKVDNDTVLQKHLNNEVWVMDSLNGNVNKKGIIGKDIEVMMDMRDQYSKTNSQNHQANVDLMIIYIFTVPFITYYPMYQREENRFRSVATTKIVQRYGILDSVVIVDKGSIVTTKNLVYDGETGDPILSRTNNEFDDPVYQFNYPAHWAYSGMGPAYKNIDAVFKNKKVIKGKMYNQDESYFNVKKFFESGDEILIESASETESVTTNANECPYYSFSGTTTNKKIWAIEASKGKEKDNGIYFIDENGKPFHGFIEQMRITRSGKRNMLGAGTGNIVSLANPMREISAGRFKIVIDSNTQVINTAATVYKDMWQVEKSFYAKDSIVKVLRDFPTIEAKAKVSVMMYDVAGSGDKRGSAFIRNSKFMVASLDFMERSICRPSRTIFTKSILEFDLSQVPSNAIVTSADFWPFEKVPNGYLPRVKENKDCGLSSNKESYDWNSATATHMGASSSWLKRITASFNATTPYTGLIATNDHRVAMNYDHVPDYYTCTSLIQDYISAGQDARYGFVFELDKTGRSNVNTSETNYLSYCGIEEANLDSKYCPSVSGTKPISCLCWAPTLYVSYKAYVDSVVKLCKENINDTATNPYRWGILGNWRADRAYTWYSDRKENDAASVDTDIRREGVLKQYTNFWQFSDSGLVKVADTTKWVWNAASSIYNKRGFEVENYDPLGRYNAGLYGYNQSLPVAVGQNSRYRELLFDGFEDYYYRNDVCDTLCQKPREFDFVKDQSGVSPDSIQKHTGRYSLKINAGSQSLLSAVVAPVDSLGYAISAQVDSVPLYKREVVGSDTTQGFLGKYIGCQGNVSQTRIDSTINFNWRTGPPMSGICTQNLYQVIWTGRIQARYSGRCTLYVRHNGIMHMYVNGIPSTEVNGVTRFILNTVAGQLYTVVLYYANPANTSSYVSLEWQSNEMARQVIPKRFMYLPNVLSAPTASIQTSIQKYCVSLNNVKPERIIRPVFSPINKKQVVVSAWMKMGGADCDTAKPLTDAMKVIFNQSGSFISEAYLEKTGVRIEGWQRYEKIVTVPANATQLQLSLTGTHSKTIYVDDIRVQPYNSSMKSFVYNAVNLRLMAELDENNYASFYEYDNDGTLIRVKKETVKGIQTIKETRSALIRDEE